MRKKDTQIVNINLLLFEWFTSLLLPINLHTHSVPNTQNCVSIIGLGSLVDGGCNVCNWSVCNLPLELGMFKDMNHRERVIYTPGGGRAFLESTVYISSSITSLTESHGVQQMHVWLSSHGGGGGVNSVSLSLRIPCLLV